MLSMNFFERNNQQLIWRNHGETLIVEPWGEDSVRVRSALMREVTLSEIRHTTRITTDYKPAQRMEVPAWAI